MSRLLQLLGIELDEVSWREKAASLAGGVVAILALIGFTEHALGLTGASALIASMGASTVLLFGVPRGALSQPWPVFGGHLCAAVIGVACAKAIGTTELAAALAVGLSILAMHQLRCVHPPGGATALVAVLGGPAVTSLGWGFVWHPVLLDALILLAVAVAFNGLFPWRRYPAGLRHRAIAASDTAQVVTHERVVAAFREIDSFVDVTEDDLVRLVELLNQPVGPKP
ncbi:MAG: HPP family protein [Acidimicrobiia bacterium]